MNNKDKIESWRSRLLDLGLINKHKKFAELAGINPVMLSRYLNGKSIPTAFIIDSIEDKLSKLEEA